MIKTGETSVGKAYSALARYYEKLAEEDGYEEWGDRVSELAKLYSKGKKCADLACGSGFFTRKLKAGGFDVFGCDISDEMLVEAQKKSVEDGLSIEYRKQNLVNFVNFEKLDVVTVINDGFNYLDGKKLKKAVSAISKNLKSGGVLIFDVSSAYKLKNVIADNIFAEDLDELTYLWFNELNGNKLTMNLTFFIKDGDKYIRKDEVHVQYVHELDFIKNVLSENSFEIVELFGKKRGLIADTDERWNFVAIKK